MSFKLSNEQIKMLIETQTAPPSTGDLYLWGKVDRKERKADKKDRKADKKLEKAAKAESRGNWRRAERLRRKAARKRGKADKKRQQAQDVKDRPDYWLRRDETGGGGYGSGFTSV